MRDITTITLKNGSIVPILGQGTWRMGESPSAAQDEIRTLQLGMDLGMTLIDTAEMYANGGAENIVGKAIAGRRNNLFIVSKVLPFNASRYGTIASCEASLRRLGTDRIDLYLLHWRSAHPLATTISAMQTLIKQGKIRGWGVSNFDHDDMNTLLAEAGGDDVQTNQVLYNLARRGIEYDLQPSCLERHIPIMAYSPIEQGRLLQHPALTAIAKQRNITPAQITLAWVLRNPGVITIPKGIGSAHIRENRASLNITLDDADLARLDQVFAPPKKKRALEMI